LQYTIAELDLESIEISVKINGLVEVPGFYSTNLALTFQPGVLRGLSGLARVPVE